MSYPADFAVILFSCNSIVNTKTSDYSLTDQNIKEVVVNITNNTQSTLDS